MSDPLSQPSSSRPRVTTSAANHSSTSLTLAEHTVTSPLPLVTESRTQSQRRRPTGRTSSGISNPRRSFSGIRRATTVMMKPQKKLAPAPTTMSSINAIIKDSWLNLMLVFIPVSWALNFALPQSFANRDTLIFVFSFLAIIPLARLLAFATDELSMRVGQTLAGLLNATLGNAVELIVAIIALVHCELQVVQSSLVGSILSNLLLVLGMCFFAGGLKYSEQGFSLIASQLNSSLLTISVIAVLLPAAFHFSAQLTDDEERRDILSVSHGVAIILLFIYGCYLVFQLYSHAMLYKDEDNTGSTKYLKREKKEKPVVPGATVTEDPKPANNDVEAGSTASDDEEEVPKMNIPVTIGLLVIVTVLVAVTAEWLVDSIDGLTDTGTISKEFVGIILLPIVGNAAEHVTAVTVSVKDKLALSIGVAVGSSIQIALFVIPFIVTLGWIMGRPLTLLFDPYESVAMFLAVLTVNYVVQDGKSNWLEGMILMCLYVILALTFWFYPGSDPSGVLAQCTR
ncbi:Sodium/calcium exchanger protein-domain-containing protein [Cyathus striatus]|nr:Sodium/calcium exchanger protein-domain-containing protein [Cyathus striatus]